MAKKVRSLKDIFGAISRRISYIIHPKKYKTENGYDAGKYWDERLSKYGFDLRGVGNIGLSHEANMEAYEEAKTFFREYLKNEGVEIEGRSILDIGCGTGFYADVFKNIARKYVGLDITDALFEKLHREYPNCDFVKKDVSSEEIEGDFDIIIMIDVTQHITNDDRFEFAMQNIKRHLNNGGIFIVTSWLRERAQKKFYERFRTIDYYKREFPDFDFGKPRPFRDKYVFTVKSTSDRD